MADNKVNFLRGTSTEYEAAIKDNDTFYYTTDDEKLYLGNKEITGGGGTSDVTKEYVDAQDTTNLNLAKAYTDNQLSYVKDDISELETNKADAVHNHDDRYYTETETDTKLSKKIDGLLKGSANGVAELDANGKVPISQLPSYVDDVIEFSSLSDFPTAGETGKIYLDTGTNLTYRWSGSEYVEISPSIALGETSSTAYRGDRGKAAYDHIADTTTHITAEERAAWNSKAELTDIPTELPANGGNADTVDGLHANEIASNPNLLINPDFKINQRGKSEYSDKSQYAVDHWWLGYSGSGNTFSFNVKTCQLVSGTKDTDEYHANLQQEIENPMQYIGKNLTLSCKMSNLSKTALIQVWRYEGNTISSIKATNYNLNEFKSLTFQIPDDITSDTKICVILQTRGECNLNWAKLELGTIATPFVPPEPATELLKCQRFYQIRSANNISSVDLRPNMRLSSPTITALRGGNYSYDAEF